MQYLHRRLPRQILTCTRCGRVLQPGEEYWFWNGNSVCADCLPDAAREELAPYRHTREGEWA
ncbi:MAG: hypothetical protein RR288_07585 [Oscillibacter sp.]